MSATRNLDRERLRVFFKHWDNLFQVVPEARREAVEAAGKEIQRSLESQIQCANLDGAGAKSRVKSWQGLRLGSGGGWAAVSPKRETVESWEKRKTYAGRFKQHTRKGEPVTARQVTTWLERGHGTPWGGYVAARQFYAYTKDDVLEIGLKAAARVLEKIGDEVDY